MPRNSNTPGIEYREFEAAVVTVAIAFAHRFWHSGAGPAVIERPVQKTSGSLSAAQAAAHIGLGRTKFYEATREPSFPKPIDVQGRKRYRVKDLEQWLQGQPHWVPKPLPRK